MTTHGKQGNLIAHLSDFSAEGMRDQDYEVALNFRSRLRLHLEQEHGMGISELVLAVWLDDTESRGDLQPAAMSLVHALDHRWFFGESVRVGPF